MNQPLVYDGLRYDVEFVDKATGRIKHVERGCNVIPQAALSFLIRAPFGGTPPISTFYAGLFENNLLPGGALVAGDIGTLITEFVGYEELQRPLWDADYDGANTYDNIGERAVFTPTVNRRIYGCFLSSSPSKGGNGGLLLSVIRFANPRDIEVGEEIRLLSGLTYLSANAM